MSEKDTINDELRAARAFRAEAKAAFASARRKKGAERVSALYRATRTYGADAGLARLKAATAAHSAARDV